MSPVIHTAYKSDTALDWYEGDMKSEYIQHMGIIEGIAF
jgi:hypothetical protein